MDVDVNFQKFNLENIKKTTEDQIQHPRDVDVNFQNSI
jgi:hypothetical protein